MAEQITSDNFERYFLNTQERLVDSLEQDNGVVDRVTLVTDIEAIKTLLSLPGVRYSADPTVDSTAVAQSYVQIPYKILAQALEDMQDATSEASSAAERVETAISDAEDATSAANTAAGAANTAADNADAKAGLANTAAQNADQKASAANTAAGAANTAAQNADAKAGLANTAAQNADAKATLANNAATSANNAATAATTAATGAENVNAVLSQQSGAVILTVTSRNGSTTEKEVGFRIAKTYASVAAMNAAIGTSEDIAEGRFAMIAGDVQDPDTAKLYVRDAVAFTYITDLSGAQGMKGDTPVMTASADGIIFADGQELTRILKTAAELFVANEGTLNGSTRGDGTRWGSYKQAEYERDSQYATAEGTRNSQYSTAEDTRDTQYESAEDARDNQYSTAESNRGTQYESAEGTSSSVAGDGSRWGTFKTSETQRQGDFTTSQTSRNTAWETWFGTSTSTGVQGDWNTLRQDIIAKTNAADTAAQNANTKASEAERVNATLSGTTITVTDRDGHQNTANLKGEQGAAAGFGTPTATVDSNVGTPSVVITASGDNTAKVFNFAFSNLKGEKGDGLNWDTMTEEDKEAVINSTAEKVEEDMVFASVQTCEDIIDELT